MGAGKQRYKIRKATKLRESMRQGLNVGQWQEHWRTADTRWDFKRKLNADGTTNAWNNADEYYAAVSANKEHQKAAAKEARHNSGSAKQARLWGDC
jgi:hypothetical protein